MRGQIVVFEHENGEEIGRFWYQGSSSALEVSKEIINKFPQVTQESVFRVLTQHGLRESIDCLVDFGDATE